MPRRPANTTAAAEPTWAALTSAAAIPAAAGMAAAIRRGPVAAVIGMAAAVTTRVAVAASPETQTRLAVTALTSLRGVDLSIASAILAAVAPDRYNVLDFRALEALGHARHDIDFYAEYVAFCRSLAERGVLKPQGDLPGPTALHALDRALWEWSRSRTE